MVITIVIVVRTIPERQISTFPIVLAIVLPPQFFGSRFNAPSISLWTEKFAKVSAHTSSHVAMLLGNFCILLLSAFMAA